MPYRISAARNDCECLVKYYIKQSKSASIKKNNIHYDFIQCVYKASFFQTSAAFEEYIRSAFEDWVTCLHVKGKTLKEAPEAIIALSSAKRNLRAYKNYIISGDESKLIDDVISNKFEKLLKDDNTLVKSVIHQTEFVSDKKYPSEDNLKKVFIRFGIKNIFTEVNKLGKKDYKLILKSFSDKRTAIAHENSIDDLTFEDVKKNLNNIINFVSVLDKVLHKHVLKISGSDCWLTQR